MNTHKENNDPDIWIKKHKCKGDAFSTVINIKQDVIDRYVKSDRAILKIIKDRLYIIPSSDVKEGVKLSGHNRNSKNLKFKYTPQVMAFEGMYNANHDSQGLYISIRERRKYD